MCCEPCNKAQRKRVQCPYCSTPVCQRCHKRYLMETTEEAHCLACRTAWTLDDKYALLPKVFWYDVDVRRAELALAQEKNLLPETMRQLRREYVLAELKKVAQQFVSTSYRLQDRVAFLEPRAQVAGRRTHDLLAHVATLQASYWTWKNELDALCSPGFTDQPGVAVPEAASASVDIYLPCPYPECRGFASSNGVCLMCSKRVCTQCRAAQAEDHVCRPEDVATTALVHADCKSCPSCHVLIHRYEGCPQMFCTVCHAKFDWNTGQLLTKIHNPHLTEWLASHRGLTASPNGCGPRSFPLMHLSPADRTVARTYHDRARYVEQVLIPSLRTSIRPVHEPLRRAFLLGTLKESVWVNELRKYHRKVERTEQLLLVLELFYTVVIQTLVHLSKQQTPWGDAKPLLEEVVRTSVTKFNELEKRYDINVHRYIAALEGTPRDVFDYDV